MLVKCLNKIGALTQVGARGMSTEVRRVVLIPGDGIGPEISKSVQDIFEAAKTPIDWDPVDVTPVKGRDGIFRIPSRCIELMHKNKVFGYQLFFITVFIGKFYTFSGSGIFVLRSALPAKQ
ncbi:hypothetical protein ANCDUO_25013 [Ancylostoma duodenale]|uniref:Isopropylmalate dehydrogenase-like domain-containing protein n=1 Tax=Ancylostoma duodenale TaxID=51022 RepID=A0A0C2C5J1_9BILA|nr:hypothetical protein ANCDUO_25013 [Ancylostoma duodenale]